MPTIKMTSKEKIGRLTRILEVGYEIPSKIICPDDGEEMEYYPHCRAYVCTKCDKYIRGAEFVKNEIDKAKVKENSISK